MEYKAPSKKHHCDSNIVQQHEFTDVPSLPRYSVPVEIDSSTSEWRYATFSRPYYQPPTSSQTSFSSFIQHLDPWEYQLLRNTDFSDDPFTLMLQWQALVDCNPSLIFCSNGSAPTFVGTFGWSCSLSSYQFRTRTGICSSFHAEAHGLLSALRFLLRLSEFIATSLPPTVPHTDSLSFITVIEMMEEWPTYYPNATLCPELNILQAIVTTKKQLKVISLSHVKGHQNRTPYIIPLSLAALLNIKADHLAGSAQ